MSHILPADKEDFLIAKTAARHLASVPENGNETGPPPVWLTIGEDPHCNIHEDKTGNLITPQRRAMFTQQIMWPVVVINM